MNLDEYQRLSLRTLGTEENSILLGLAGETGEVLDLIKKHKYHGHDLDRDALAGELGDVLWYVAGIASHHGLSLGDIAKRNVTKLAERYPDGFSHEASRNRPSPTPERCTLFCSYCNPLHPDDCVLSSHDDAADCRCEEHRDHG